VPGPVLDRARQILDQLETQHAAMSKAAAATHETVAASAIGASPRSHVPKVRVKTARGLTSSLFAALPDPLVVELQETDTDVLSPDEALRLVRRWKGIVG
jgi:hypothetical protein